MATMKKLDDAKKYLTKNKELDENMASSSASTDDNKELKKEKRWRRSLGRLNYVSGI